MRTDTNPCGLQGLSYLEFGAESNARVEPILTALGFTHVATVNNHSRFRSGDIEVFLDCREGSFARTYAELHGPALSGLAFRVDSPAIAFKRALECGAKPLPSHPGANYAYAVQGIGGIGFYFVDAQERPGPVMDLRHTGAGDLVSVDHITFNVPTGQREHWNAFLESAFGFSNVFDSELPVDGTRSRTTVMQSPCGYIRLAANEPLDLGSPLHRQMHAFNGPGMQHLAFATADILALAERLDQTMLRPLVVPESHYDGAAGLAARSGVPLEQLRSMNIMIGGHDDNGSGWMFQRFTQPTLGPSFFEFVQRVDFEQGFAQDTARTLLKTISILDKSS